MQSRIFSRPVAGAIGFVVSRPVAFWINAALVSTWLYLLWPLFSPVYSSCDLCRLSNDPDSTRAGLCLSGPNWQQADQHRTIDGLRFRLRVRRDLLTPLDSCARAEIFGTNCNERPASLLHVYGRPNSSGRMIPQQGGNDFENDFTGSTRLDSGSNAH